MKELVNNKSRIMNKKVLFGIMFATAVVCLASCLCLAVKPAGAVPSPTLPSASSNGITFTALSAEKGDINQLVIEPTSQQASGVEVDSSKGEKCVANFYVTTKKGDSYLPEYYGVSFAAGADKAYAVANKDARIYVDHHDGSHEVITGKFNASGSITFYVKNLSLFSIVTQYDENAGNQASGANTSAVSPKTGVL